MALAAAALTGLHGLWLILVGRWRRQGALSPNIVIVGATDAAKKLIETALKTREVAVLGVLDWGLGVEGAFLWMIASGVAVFAAVATLTRPSPAPEP